MYDSQIRKGMYVVFKQTNIYTVLINLCNADIERIYDQHSEYTNDQLLSI